MNPVPKAVIFGCKTTYLLPEERDFFSRTHPLGFILFTRNCEAPDQVRQLVNDLRACIGNPEAPILIDQEGGRVARLSAPHWQEWPAAGTFGQIAEDDPEQASWCVRANSWLIGQDLRDLGITVNCAPVVDVLHSETHPVIGDRSYGEKPDLVSTLALQSIKGFQEANITPVIKHLPGHGPATHDSHLTLPTISLEEDQLASKDFEAFRQVCRLFQRSTDQVPWGMTAHVIYKSIDPARPATQSSIIIESIIRGHIGFKGFLLSDCLTMKALEGTLSKRATLSLEAGCDAVLHCSGILEEMIEIASVVPQLRPDSLVRYQASIRQNPQPPYFTDIDSVREMLTHTLSLETPLSPQRKQKLK